MVSISKFFASLYFFFCSNQICANKKFLKTCQWKKWDCCLHYLSSSCLILLYFLITAKREKGFFCFQYCYWFLSAISSRFFSSVSCPFRVPCSYLALCNSQVTLPLSYFSILLKYNCKKLFGDYIAHILT